MAVKAPAPLSRSRGLRRRRNHHPGKVGGRLFHRDLCRRKLAEPRPDVGQGREIAQVMGFDGAPWLDRPSREREERPDWLIAELRLRPGMSVEPTVYTK